jgi:hypothetical protein
MHVEKRESVCVDSGKDLFLYMHVSQIVVE